MYRHAVASVNGRDRVRTHLAGWEPGARVRVIAIGKAAGPMAIGACDALGAAVESVMVITKYGHATAGLPSGVPVTTIEAGHPLPDANSLRAGIDLFGFIARAPAPSTFLFLISGGASALVEAPPEPVRFADLRRAHDWLLGCGWDIAAINRVRTRLSLIKGGRLASYLGGVRTLQLLISDVPGDDPAVIGSGLLTPAASNGPPGREPPAWLAELAAYTPDPPAAGAPCFSAIETRLIATSRDARLSAAECAHALGYRVRQYPELITGEAEQAGRRLARLLRDEGPLLHVWSGETVVTLPEAPGRGGRCQHLALAAAAELAGLSGHVLLAAGTDGGDGPGAAAGAVIDGDTVARGRARGLDPLESLRRADAGAFLEASNDLIPAGASGTNVMDLLLACKPAG
ncbi:MAG: DUF4147 domain-containing protein [Gammaproteobacteria bacterium]|nr:DUF4147 domain-containing protein [Gammaproteobacteria bacterium]